ncbi:unnamed protein product [Amoebophrya sp. A25]|nr:unnamed protein product [Amoebophrya sp. A25]|eukprot:GSA25T00000769001.1
MAFVRRDSRFRECLGSVAFPYEPNRYVLYVSPACPWANRTMTVAKLRGLTNKELPIVRVHPTWQATKPGVDEHCGWVFRAAREPVMPLALKKLQDEAASSAKEKPVGALSALDEVEQGSSSGTTGQNQKESQKMLGTEGVAAFVTAAGEISTPNCDPDSLSGWDCRTLRELYEHCGESLEAGGKFTTPLIFCRKTQKIVNNESSEIIVQLDAWPDDAVDGTIKRSAFAPETLNPGALQDEMRKLDDFTYHKINNGVYKCGFCRTQAAYETAIDDLMEGMQFLEERFRSQTEDFREKPFLFGKTLTLSDVRLFQTLIRMDECYVIYFKCFPASLLFFPEVLKYTARVWAAPEVRSSTHLHDCKLHYFSSHPHLNPFAVVPRDTGIWDRLFNMTEDGGAYA